jgi:predicted dehydrogenase
VGIIGCGYISRFHIEGFERAGAKIVHACDIRKEAADAVGARCQCRASTDYRAVIADPRVELVSICTIASTHRPIALAAVAAGKGVICEKTLTDNPADSAGIARAADKPGTFFATAYMKNFFPATMKAKELLADMGEIVSLYARTWQPFAALWEEPLPEAYAKRPSFIMRNYGGGVLVCGGSHILNLIHGFAGRPTRVSGRMRFRKGLDVDIQANAMLWLPGGGVAHFEALWHPHRAVGYERNGWDERFEINTPQGRLELYTVLWNQPTNNGALLIHHDAASGRVTEYRFPAVNSFHVEIADMVKRFRTRKPGFPSAWDGYVVDELIAHITASAHREGAMVPVRWKDRQ